MEAVLKFEGNLASAFVGEMAQPSPLSQLPGFCINW